MIGRYAQDGRCGEERQREDGGRWGWVGRLSSPRREEEGNK
jgi:hypothetical protein